MPERRFLVASSLARLLRKDRGAVSRIVEGYFPARPGLDHFVSIEPGHAYLVLAAARDGAGAEERTEVPRSQAEALLPVCAGKVGFECTIVRLQSEKEALLQRFIAPGSLDLLSVEFAEGEDANGFMPPAWFGPEVTQNPAYERGSLARAGMPTPEEVPLSNAMLDELLDTIESGEATVQPGGKSLPQATDAHEAEQRIEGAVSEADQRPAESTHRDGLIEGLAEALKVEAPGSAPDSEGPSVVRSFRFRKS